MTYNGQREGLQSTARPKRAPVFLSQKRTSAHHRQPASANQHMDNIDRCNVTARDQTDVYCMDDTGWSEAEFDSSSHYENLSNFAQQGQTHPEARSIHETSKPRMGCSSFHNDQNQGQQKLSGMRRDTDQHIYDIDSPPSPSEKGSAQILQHSPAPLGMGGASMDASLQESNAIYENTRLLSRAGQHSQTTCWNTVGSQQQLSRPQSHASPSLKVSTNSFQSPRKPRGSMSGRPRPPSAEITTDASGSSKSGLLVTTPHGYSTNIPENTPDGYQSPKSELPTSPFNRSQNIVTNQLLSAGQKSPKPRSAVPDFIEAPKRGMCSCTCVWMDGWLEFNGTLTRKCHISASQSCAIIVDTCV